MSKSCPVCDTPTVDFEPGERTRVTCPRCGVYEISGTAIAETGWVNGRPDAEIRRAKVSFALRRMQESTDPPLLTSDLRDQIVDRTELPTPVGMAERLLLIFGDALKSNPGERERYVEGEIDGLSARIGGLNRNDVFYALLQLDDQGFVQRDPTMGSVGGRLTLAGWEKYEELRRSASKSRLAFMAMPFGDPKLDHVFNSCFRPAVDATGFKLFRLDDQPPAGSIDNRLRVEIRRSRFLIAELSQDNSGAYWEAGFAEGLGRPVIFTCEEGQKTHFDTRQMQTIFWHEDNLDNAARRLKATVRATLPDEAQLEDDPTPSKK